MQLEGTKPAVAALMLSSIAVVLRSSYGPSDRWRARQDDNADFCTLVSGILIITFPSVR